MKNVLFLMSLGKCPKCEKYGVAFAHRKDWVGETCIHCDWEEKHEEATADWIRMQSDFVKDILKKHPEWREKLAK